MKDLDDEELDSGWLDDKSQSATDPPEVSDEPATTIRGPTLKDLVEQELAIAKRRRDSGEDI